MIKGYLLYFGEMELSINVSIMSIIDSGFGFSHIPFKMYPPSLIAAPVVGPIAKICKS